MRCLDAPARRFPAVSRHVGACEDAGLDSAADAIRNEGILGARTGSAVAARLMLAKAGAVDLRERRCLPAFGSAIPKVAEVCLAEVSVLTSCTLRLPPSEKLNCWAGSSENESSRSAISTVIVKVSGTNRMPLKRSSMHNFRSAKRRIRPPKWPQNDLSGEVIIDLIYVVDYKPYVIYTTTLTPNCGSPGAMQTFE